MGRRSIALVGTQLFLLSERLLWLAEDALDSWQSARPLFRRVELEGVRLGVRRGPGDAPLALTIAILPGEGDRPKQLTLSDIDTTDFVEAATHFAESLGERFVLHDPAQKQNLRLNVLVESARILRERLSELRQDDVLTNQERESYKSYGLPQVAPARPQPWDHGGKMRFSPRWVAAVPAIDLRSTFLYADQFIVGVCARAGVFGSGEWQCPLARAFGASCHGGNAARPGASARRRAGAAACPGKWRSARRRPTRTARRRRSCGGLGQHARFAAPALARRRRPSHHGARPCDGRGALAPQGITPGAVSPAQGRPAHLGHGW